MTELSPNNILRSGLCIGCGSCAAQALISGKKAGMRFDRYGQLIPNGKDWIGSPTKDLAETCPFSPYSLNEDDLSVQLFKEASKSDKLIGKYIICTAGSLSPDLIST